MAGVKIEDVRKFALEKELDEDLALKIVEQTLKAAYKTAFKTDVNAVVITGDDAVSIYARKKIVDDVVNPVLEVDIEEATKLAPDCELGDELLFELDPKDFKRGSIQAGVQRVHQSTREIQKDSIYSEYKAKEGEIIIGYYQRKKNDNIYVDLGKVEGLLPRKFQLPQEIYHPNDRIKALIKEVKKHRQSNVVQLILSRTDPDFVRRLMELEVPEIYDNIVELYKIVREPGYRTKVAVISHREDVDPVGACVGPKGTRIQTIITELEGEKIDVLEYSSDPAVFIANALSPAEVLDVVILDTEKRTALAVVAESQLSIAIGKQGLNVRLANRLADWSIDVKTEKQFQEMDIHAETRKAAEELFNDDVALLTEVEGIDPDVLALLHENHIETVEQLLDTPREELCALPGMSEEKVNALETLISESFEIVDENQEPEQEVQSKNQPISASAEDEEEEVYECPECGAPITIDMTVCPNCGVGLSFEYEDEE
ncbi:MAG: transcription termination factor NusA [Treponema sp.]|jgi:transcription elongation protein nusA|uniref:Transcription termination/antitermination protein NusA n=1 Tax=Treponema vincentii TaxID=69710 RepID=A0A6P1XYK8_9SPIR|nr:MULTISPECIES: transcription termination factor NusA [Treponema]QHX42646.1 transcription termination/antitermination protein NusA [Treponema vincentii]UTC53709.1 transcription termination/antitermination protein NusA [Treponema sp. OMZ 803]UTC56160.1 transcription termination/antitermination protein NusA [Treponema sp. OMZ 906]